VTKSTGQRHVAFPKPILRGLTAPDLGVADAPYDPTGKTALMIDVSMRKLIDSNPT